MITQENIPYTTDEIKAMVKTIESLRKTQKKYQDALEKVKGLLKDSEMALHAREKLVNVFPELAESEDEKIRKAIHIYLDWLDGRKDYAPKGNYTIRDMIAWLQKQGVQKSVRKRKIDDAYLQGICDAKHEIEKQGKALNADEVIEWLKTKVYDDSTYGMAMIEQFKKDFEI